MTAIKNLNKWANSHSEFYILDLFRWTLGALLFYKGVQFMLNTEYLIDIIHPQSRDLLTIVLVHYIALAHLAGGIFIVLGLLTRIALLIQVPILFGAVLVGMSTGIGMVEAVQALYALLAGLTFLIIGSGKHSIDYNLKLQV